MTLFRNIPFTGHSGQKLRFKIECDGLTQEDIETFAAIVASEFTFKRVIGVPTGGMPLAEALEKYCKEEGCVLIVDDVLTTGGSMEKTRTQYTDEDDEVQGVVFFARSECPDWVECMFQLSPWAGP